MVYGQNKSYSQKIEIAWIVAAPGQRIGSKSIMNRRNSMFKFKTFLPQTLQVEVKKWPNFKKNERQKRVILFLWK